ncbi:MAG TPA: M56 family metallopeptidase [Longimicrobium sp.]|jgi:beta-lactamase regulating signal transducer with metallopeptidase domain
MSAAPALVGVLLSGLAGGVLVALLVALVLRAAPRAAPRARYVFVLGALALTIAAPLLRAAAGSSGAASRAARGVVVVPVRLRLEAAPAPATGGAPAAPPAIGAVPGWEAILRAAASPRVAPWILALWAAGALVLLGREALAHRWFRQRRRGWRLASVAPEALPAGLRRTPVFLSPHDGPLAVGLLRPRVVLPDWLPPDAAAAVLRHELEHVRWRDPLVNAVVRLACAVLWPWPHVWYLAGLARIEREVAADRAGAGPGGEREAARYAETLLRVARRAPPSVRAAACSSYAAADLERRIRRLFVPAERTGWRLAVLGPAALLLWAGTAAALPPSAPAGPRPGPAPPGPRSRAAAPRALPRAAAAAPALASPASPRTPPEAGPARQPLRFVNLPGTPLEVVEASAAAAGADQIGRPVVRLRNRSRETVSAFALAFVVAGRATAVVHDTSDIGPGEHYVVRLPGEGRINAAAGAVAVSVIRAEIAGREPWGTAAPPGLLPPLPAGLAAASTRAR